MKALVENIIREEVRRKVDEYFGSLLELEKGPIVQVHAAVTRNGLTKPARRTKTSQLCDMELNSPTFYKTPKNLSIEKWESRWCAMRCYVQYKTGFKWKVNIDREQGGIWVTRTR